MGAGTTGIASKMENRNFIGIEREEEYFSIAQHRIDDVPVQEVAQGRWQKAQETL
jgi:DNA modification methylase